MAERKDAVYHLLQEIDSHLFGANAETHLLRRVPCPASFRIVSTSGIIRTTEETLPAEARMLRDGTIRFQAATDAPRGREVEIDVLAEWDASGERHLIGRVLVRKTTRVSGGYEFEGEIRSMRSRMVHMDWVFATHAARADAGGWNRRMSDLEEGALLRGLNLREAKLANFDLCAADLTGSDLRKADLTQANLAGANLTDCKLDGARVAGADLFAVQIPYQYRGLLPASGLIEIESVTLVGEE